VSCRLDSSGELQPKEHCVLAVGPAVNLKLLLHTVKLRVSPAA